MKRKGRCPAPAYSTQSLRLGGARTRPVLREFPESQHPEENVIAILLRLEDKRAALRRILARIARAEPSRHARALEALFILARLRRLGAD